MCGIFKEYGIRLETGERKPETGDRKKMKGWRVEGKKLQITDYRLMYFNIVNLLFNSSDSAHVPTPLSMT
jgi:hypothetical protein